MGTQAQIDIVTNDQLIDMLVGLEDEVPRSVIDECVNRGESMAQALIALLNDEYAVHNDELHLSAWPRLHAIVVLGLRVGRRRSCSGVRLENSHE